MEAVSFRDAAVIEQSERFVCVRLNVRTARNLASQHGVQYVPDIRFLDSHGHEQQQLGGYHEPAELAQAMRDAADQIEAGGDHGGEPPRPPRRREGSGG